MRSLKDIFDNHSGRMIHKLSHYFDVYERYFSKYRGKDVIVLEIGISHGGSLQMWKEYFGDKLKLFAVDINPECKKLEEDGTTIFIGSQEDEDFLSGLIKDMPRPDIIIDDGGHTMRQQVVSFEMLYRHVKDDGIYLCEDTLTSYWYEYGGGFRKKNTFVEYSKRQIDRLYAWHYKSRKVQPDWFSMSTNSIHFYDSMVVFEKKPRSKPQDLMVGEKAINHNEDPVADKRTLFHKVVKRLKSL